MDDYRTWWRKGSDVEDVMTEFAIQFSYSFDGFIEPNGNDADCVIEQMWAIREGLAEEIK